MKYRAGMVRPQRGDNDLGEFRLHVPGTHNILNATAAIAVGTGLDVPTDQIRAAFNWRGFFHRTCLIDELNVQQLIIRFANRSGAEPTPVKVAPQQNRSSEGWTLDLRKANVAQSTWTWATNDGTAGSITGSSFTLTPSSDSWLIDASSGKLSQTGWPVLSIESAKLRYTSSSLFVTESVLRTGTGRITLSGEIDFKQAANLQTQFADVPVTPLLPPDWRVRLTGKVAGVASIHAPLSDGSVHVEGHMQLVDGQVEALPLLDQIATFTRTERFRRLSLSKASLSFTRDLEASSRARAAGGARKMGGAPERGRRGFAEWRDSAFSPWLGPR